MKNLISGASGFIGTKLKRKWETDTHEVIPLKRDYSHLVECDAVIHLRGELKLPTEPLKIAAARALFNLPYSHAIRIFRQIVPCRFCT